MDIPPWARRPQWADGLVAQVAREFAVTAAAHPGWSDPHETAEPDELAYSVCSDPGKYRILDARVEAWAQVLDHSGLADVSEPPPPGPDWLAAPRSPEQLNRVWVMAPTVRGGLTLWFAQTLVDDEPFGIDIGVSAEGLPIVNLESVPDCGCDTCDHGSEPELDAIDSAVLTIARGEVVHARDEWSNTTAGIESWRASNHAPESWLDPDTPVPKGVRRWMGAPWLKT